MLLGDAVNGGQTQASALTQFLGGEEGLKDMLNSGRIHPHPGVRDAEPDVAARLDIGVEPGVVFVERYVFGLNQQLTALEHGITRIQAQTYLHFTLPAASVSGWSRLSRAVTRRPVSGSL